MIYQIDNQSISERQVFQWKKETNRMNNNVLYFIFITRDENHKVVNVKLISTF